MTDLSLTIAPKSDQLNSDDMIGGPMTVQITKVSANPESAEQPISIFFDGDNGKPYRPCKSMRRVMVQVWGKDGTQYAGRAMTLYRDPKVQFGGLAVGGIRISHMSHIDADVTMALTATRANRKPFTVKPLRKAAAPQSSPLNGFDEALSMAGDWDAGRRVAKDADAPPKPKPKATVRDFLDRTEAALIEADTAGIYAIIDSPDVQRALKTLTNGALDRLNAMLKAAMDRTDDGSSAAEPPSSVDEPPMREGDV